jgi:hypothetical protein
MMMVSVYLIRRKVTQGLVQAVSVVIAYEGGDVLPGVLQRTVVA